MRCHICDSVLSTPIYNGQWEEFEPCPTCLAVINDVFEDTPDQIPLPLEPESTTEDVDLDELNDEIVGGLDIDYSGEPEAA